MLLNKNKFNLTVQFILFILIFQFTILIQADNEEKINIITSEWNNYTNKDGSGLYFDILNLTLGKDKINYVFSPWKRAQIDFSSKKFQGILGESGGVDYCLYPKWPIDADFFSALHLKSKIQSWPGINNLKNYKIIWVRGYNLNLFEPKLKPYAEVDNVEQGIKMIIGGRADILIDYDQDLKDYLHKNSLSNTENLITPTEISGGYIYFCMQKDSKYKDILDKFDINMEMLKKSGELRNLFKKYNRIKNYDKIIKHN